jgi:hypothetical protein
MEIRVPTRKRSLFFRDGCAPRNVQERNFGAGSAGEFDKMLLAPARDVTVAWRAALEDHARFAPGIFTCETQNVTCFARRDCAPRATAFP